MMMASLFGAFNLIIVLTLMGLSIYSLVLFIMLARRGVKALDIYINKNSNN